jgi:hypothetical protein
LTAAATRIHGNERCWTMGHGKARGRGQRTDG